MSPLIAQTIDMQLRPNVVRHVQLTAARHHLDYVLIYVLNREDAGLNAMGRAEVMMMDVNTMLQDLYARAE